MDNSKLLYFSRKTKVGIQVFSLESLILQRYPRSPERDEKLRRFKNVNISVIHAGPSQGIFFTKNNIKHKFSKQQSTDKSFSIPWLEMMEQLNENFSEQVVVKDFWQSF